MNPAPQETLRNVRHAYRLLHDYQRLVLDSLKFIGNQLGFHYRGGWNKYCGGAPRDGKGSLDNWAWDWLGLYFYEFHFERIISGGRVLKLSALHMPDTAALGVTNREDTSTFPSADLSQSKVAFIFHEGPVGWDFEPITADPKAPLGLVENGVLPEKCLAAGMCAIVYDLERLFTEESAQTVVAELRQRFGIPADFSPSA